jgi:FSR family fosmidomycin resistance protein-like MFS transporter
MLPSLFALFGVEFLDEFIYGLQGAILPKLRDDLALSYTQVGLLFTIPGLVSIAGEPVIGLIGDTRYRRALVVGGIAATALGLFLTGIGQTFAIILIAFSILYIASGAYVNLTQATLIDRNPPRAERTMAVWTLIGSIALAVAPIILTALFFLGQDWRVIYLVLAVVAAVYIVILARQRFDAHAGAQRHSISPQELARDLIGGLKNRELMRWVIVTELADLMLDKLLEVTGLYFYDVVGVDIAQASGAVRHRYDRGLVGSALLVPALDKMHTRILRASAVVTLVLYIAFLLIPFGWAKFALIALISLATSAWFPILRANTYNVLPGQSGLIVSVTSLANVSSVFVPVILGRIADIFGLQWAMWLFVIGPIALIVGLPKSQLTVISNQ